MLIRREVNGGLLGSSITTLTSTDCTAQYTDHNKELAYLCNSCHEDDAEAGVGSANKWCYVHHQGGSGDPPYSFNQCNKCHTGTGGMSNGCYAARDAINCNCCHYHGSSAASRVTF